MFFTVVQDLINQESGDGWEDSDDDDSNSGVDDGKPVCAIKY